MVKPPREVAGFFALPLRFPRTDAFPHDATHYLYLKPHDPPIPDADASRSLFLVNVPVSSTVQSLRYLFTTGLEGGRIEHVYFADQIPDKGESKGNRKRKRMTADEFEAGLKKYTLPKIFDSQILATGATAVVVFVDRPSMELTLKAAKRAAKLRTAVEWPGARGSRLGLARYERHKHLQYPPQKDLLRLVNAFMTTYAEMETSRGRENARKRAEPDEDGFVTVTRGSKGSARLDEAKELAEKHKEKAQGLEDFYRFQMREKRKQEHVEMLQKFEQDKKKVEEMRRHRTKAQPE